MAEKIPKKRRAVFSLKKQNDRSPLGCAGSHDGPLTFEGIILQKVKNIDSRRRND